MIGQYKLEVGGVCRATGAPCSLDVFFSHTPKVNLPYRLRMISRVRGNQACKINCAPREARTPDLEVNSLTL
jgi:hypothetical protein